MHSKWKVLNLKSANKTLKFLTELYPGILEIVSAENEHQVDGTEIYKNYPLNLNVVCLKLVPQLQAGAHFQLKFPQKSEFLESWLFLQEKPRNL